MLRTKPLLRNSRLHQWVHHPDPLTAEQTKRFLDTVTTSFRKNLDQEHSPVVEHEGLSKAPLTESNNRPCTTTTDARDYVTEAGPHLPASGLPFRPTDHHLSSILSNPLFRRTQNSPVEPGAKRDPMDVFDVAVSKGLMTVDIARGCMIAKYRTISRPHGRLTTDIPAPEEGLAKAGVCDRVLRWLQSSGLNRSLEFASYHSFVKALMPFLLAEGKEKLAWDWTWQMLSGKEAYKREGDAKHLLYVLVTGKTVRQPIDIALEAIIQASYTYRWYPRHAHVLRGPWVSLSDRTTAIASVAPPASASLFNTYLGLADHLGPRTLQLPIAHLHLHHPATPTYDRALEYFEHIESEKSRAPPLAKNTEARQQREAVMGLDTINRLSQIGKFEEADSLMAFVKSRYKALSWIFPDAALSSLEHT